MSTTTEKKKRNNGDDDERAKSVLNENGRRNFDENNCIAVGKFN